MADITVTNNNTVAISVQYEPAATRDIAPGASDTFTVKKGDKAHGHIALTASVVGSADFANAGPETLLVVPPSGSTVTLAAGQSGSANVGPVATNVREA